MHSNSTPIRECEAISLFEMTKSWLLHKIQRGKWLHYFLRKRLYKENSKAVYVVYVTFHVMFLEKPKFAAKNNGGRRGHYLGPLAQNVHFIVHLADRWAGVETMQHIPSEGAGGVYPRAAVFTFVKFSQL